MLPRFEHDLSQERLLQPYLDRRYAAHGIRAERSTDRVEQAAGIDVRLTKGGLTYAVDEKAQLHYIGKSLPTFALEVDMRIAGGTRPGWLFDERKRTEVYAFVFDIALHDGHSELHNADHVASAHIVLVNRARLIAHLAKAGLDEHMLHKLARELRESDSDQRSVKAPGVRVILSRHYAEQPVNLLVTRRFRESIGQVMKA